jgi:hypothetical protein
MNESFVDGRGDTPAVVGLLELAKQLGNVSRASRVMGYSRDSFFRFRELYDGWGRSISRSVPLARSAAYSISYDRRSEGE